MSRINAALLLFREVFAELGDRLVIVCCACGRWVGTPPALGPGGVSHGYCGPCGDAALEETRRYLRAHGLEA